MDSSTRPPRRGLPAGWLAPCLFALAFGLVLALYRPAFQVSDEVAYLAAVQVSLAESGLDPGPPPCNLLAERVTWAVAARPAFAGATIPVLQTACRVTGSPALAFVVARAALSLSLPLLAVATLLAGRRLWPSEPAIAWMGALMVATHAVLASYQAAFTPDALANLGAGMAAALTVAAVTARRLAARAAWIVAALAAAASAALVKDTAIALTVVLVVASPFIIASGWRGHAAVRRGLLVAAPVAALAGLVFLWRSGGPLLARWFEAADGGSGRSVDLLEVLRVTAAAILPYFVSMTIEAGNFGGASVPLPPLWLAGWGLVLVGAAAGLARLAWRRPAWLEQPTAFGWLSLVFGLAMLATLLQAPLRNVVIDRATAVQGRWLFPLAVPAALWIAAGLRAWLPAPRLVPLVAVLAVGGAWTATLWTILPRYYAEFPSTVSRAHLFLRSAYGGAVDAAGVDAFLVRAGWLGDPRVAWGVLGALLVAGGLVVASSLRGVQSGAISRELTR